MGKLLYRVAMDYQAMAVRFGGDEFILLRTVAKLEEMLQVGEALRKAVNNFNAKKQRPYALTFSMGTTVFQGERQSLDDFLGTWMRLCTRVSATDPMQRYWQGWNTAMHVPTAAMGISNDFEIMNKKNYFIIYSML